MWRLPAGRGGHSESFEARAMTTGRRAPSKGKQFLRDSESKRRLFLNCLLTRYHADPAFLQFSLGCGAPGLWTLLGSLLSTITVTFGHLAPYISKVSTLSVALNTNPIENGSLSPAATIRAGVVRAEWNQVQG